MNLPQDAYNPSLINHHGRKLLTCRAHDRNDWRTSLFLCESDAHFKIASCSKVVMPETIANHSHEDARLFTFQGGLWMSWTISRFPASEFRCVVAFGQLVQIEGEWRVARWFLPKYGRNDFSALEKNWVAFETNNQMWCYYLTHEKQQIFFRLEGERVVETVKSGTLPWQYGPIHGGAIVVLPNGSLMHAFNSRTGRLEMATHRYHIGFAELSGSPPFEMRRISARPVLYGQEGYNLDGCRHFKSNVVFAGGLIVENDDLWLAYGWNDCRSRVMRLTLNELGL